MKRAVLPVLLVVTLAACGGSSGNKGSTSSNSSSSAPPPPAAGGSNTGGGSLSTPIVIGLAGGQTAAGVDISVPSPAASPAPNATVLGVAPTGPGGSASSTGDVVHLGSTVKILLFGPGLSGDMQISISGPNDITIQNIRTITATDKTPGVAFDASVSSSAALGARTVILRNAQNDITTFTGGLEVVP